jgi:hypothetical protein
MLFACFLAGQIFFEGYSIVFTVSVLHFLSVAQFTSSMGWSRIYIYIGVLLPIECLDQVRNWKLIRKRKRYRQDSRTACESIRGKVAPGFLSLFFAFLYSLYRLSLIPSLLFIPPFPSPQRLIFIVIVILTILFSIALLL